MNNELQIEAMERKLQEMQREIEVLKKEQQQNA